MSVSASSCGREPALADPGALDDPLVGRVDELLEILVREDTVGHVDAEAGDPDRAPLADPITTLIHRERQRAAHGELAVDGRTRLPAPDRAANGFEVALELERSPGRTTRLKRTPSMPAKSAIRPGPLGSAPRQRRPARAPRPSSRRHDRVSGEVPRAILLGDELARDDTQPGSSSITSSSRGTDRGAAGSPRSRLVPAGSAVMPRPLAEAVAAAVRVALGRADRHPLGVRDRRELKSKACSRTTTLAWTA